MPDNKDKGLYEKYHVRRVDGKPMKGGGCMVMEWGDPNGREGIKAFSKAVRLDGYEKLADELDETVLAYEAEDAK